MKIYKGIKIPTYNEKIKMTGITQELVELIQSGKMEIGDMVIMPHDCTNVRQKLYDTGQRIKVRFERAQNKYNIWRIK